MLLVITITRDEQLADVTDLLDFPYARLDVNAESQPDLTYRMGNKGLRFFLGKLDLSKIKSVWYKLAWMTYPEKHRHNPYWLFNRLNRTVLVEQLYDLLPNAIWISHPHAVRRAENKILQMQIARELGFSIPETLVTGNAGDVSCFRKEQGSIVVKPTAKDLVFKDGKPIMFMTNLVRPSDPLDLSLLGEAPAIFQKEVQRKTELRVTVVGDKVFAASVMREDERAGLVDWRIGGKEGLLIEQYELGAGLENQCVELVKALGLEFGCIDMIVDPEDSYNFLEVNPNGSWKFIQESTGQPIAQAIARLLDYNRVD